MAANNIKVKTDKALTKSMVEKLSKYQGTHINIKNNNLFNQMG